MKLLLLFFIAIMIGNKFAIGQNYTEILGRPTNSSITTSILFDQKADVYWEYGTASGNYTNSTANFVAEKDIPLEIDLTGLITDKEYFYRTRFRPTGNTTPFLTGAEHSFHTQRAKGSTFTFAVEADPHLDTNSNPSSFALTLKNILLKKPDFLIDLGDIFMSEKQPVINQTVITDRHLLYRPYFNEVCSSVPLYLALGNHEGELGWLLNGTANSIPVMTSNTRKLYYPNPLPNVFYSGNTKEEPFVGLRENYYAWEWGDALFVVMDPFWYTVKKPDWGWTLGQEQYNWFKNVITTSQAKFKFVFCHNLLGGKGNDARGGSEYAGMFEMGGNNLDASWGFDSFRPYWEMPIHTLMVENNATIFFHGHDHFYGKQEKDGIVYQEVPQPSNKNITNISASQYGYVDGIFLPGRGYLMVTVSDASTKVEYISTYLPNEENATHKNTDVAHSYEISSPVTGVENRNEIQTTFQLKQNFPNPFSGETSITYSIPVAEHVTLKVFDIYGRESATLVNQLQQAGTYSVFLNPDKLCLPGGIYYYKVTVGKNSKCMKMICIN
jgi:hypothetical protein